MTNENNINYVDCELSLTKEFKGFKDEYLDKASIIEYVIYDILDTPQIKFHIDCEITSHTMESVDITKIKAGHKLNKEKITSKYLNMDINIYDKPEPVVKRIVSEFMNITLQKIESRLYEIIQENEAQFEEELEELKRNREMFEGEVTSIKPIANAYIINRLSEDGYTELFYDGYCY